MTKITMNLSSSSIEAAISVLNNYKSDMHNKETKLRTKVAEKLREDCDTGFNGALYDDVIFGDKLVPNVEVIADVDGNPAKVIAHGDAVTFIEFGAGVYHNPSGSPNPLKPAGIVPIGTYGKGYGSRTIWKYFRDGKVVVTHGTPASMPMYKAIQEVKGEIPSMAKKIFEGGGDSD